MHPDYLPTTAQGKRHRLMEECAEVIKECAKIGRFGLMSTHPDGGPSNLQAALNEIEDLQHAIQEWLNDPVIAFHIRKLNDASQ